MIKRMINEAQQYVQGNLKVKYGMVIGIVVVILIVMLYKKTHVDVIDDDYISDFDDDDFEYPAFEDSDGDDFAE